MAAFRDDFKRVQTRSPSVTTENFGRNPSRIVPV